MTRRGGRANDKGPMLLLEHHGKIPLRKHGIPTPQGAIVGDASALSDVMHTLPERLVLKAQIASGRRGKGGGIAFATGRKTAIEAFNALRGSKVDGHAVDIVLVEEQIAFAQERYAGVLIEDGEIRTGKAKRLPFRENPEGGTIGLIGLGGGLNVTLMDWIADGGAKVAALVDIDDAIGASHAEQALRWRSNLRPASENQVHSGKCHHLWLSAGRYRYRAGGSACQAQHIPQQADHAASARQRHGEDAGPVGGGGPNQQRLARRRDLGGHRRGKGLTWRSWQRPTASSCMA